MSRAAAPDSSTFKREQEPDVMSSTPERVIRGTMWIAPIIAILGCKSRSVSPIDVNCGHGATFTPNYEFDCSNQDEEGDAEAVDSLYEKFAWGVFRWMNPADGEAPWQSWAALPIVTQPTCRAPGDLSAFAYPPTQGDCAMPQARPPDFNPLVDINGNQVQFETRVDPQVQKRLDGAKNELQAFCAGDTQSNSWSDGQTSDEPGPMRIKIAWKQVVAQDCALGRQFVLKSTMRLGCEAGQQGMVAMHIALKTFSGAYAWTWATFSHRDNLASSNPMFEPCGDDDPACNQCPGSPTEPTHLRRVAAIPPRIAALNAMNALLGGPDQYLLVGVQRRFETWANAPSVARPEVFASEIFEWDRQTTSCIGCHGRATVLSPPGSDQQATSCCTQLAAPECRDTNRYLRCAPNQPTSGAPAVTADYFMGLTAWYQTSNNTPRISHD